MKTDPRTRYTRQIITEAFWQLLRQKSIEKITVKEICALAQINRGTFYRHFQDCYDLMAQLEMQALDQLDQALAAIKEDGLQELLCSILKKLQNDELLAVLARQGRNDMFLHRMVGQCFRYMDQCLGTQEESKGDALWHDIKNTFLFAGATGVMEYWLRSGHKTPPEQVAAAIVNLCANAAGAEPAKLQ